VAWVNCLQVVSSGESRAGTVGAVPAQPELENGRVRGFLTAMGFI